MAVEPESFCWLLGREEAGRDGQLWAEHLEKFPSLEYLVRDGGIGLAKGVESLRKRRPGLQDGLDVFHTFREGNKALRKTWGRASRAMDRAAAAQRKLDQLARRGESRQGKGAAVARYWRDAERLFDEATATESAWREIREALDLFTPQGKLQDRAQAEAMVAAALSRLKGDDWAKTVRFLRKPETFTFLDRAGEQLARLGLPNDTLEALVSLEGLRRRAKHLNGNDPASGAAWALAIARSVELHRRDPDWPRQAALVRQALRRAWRASSLVEGINSVARMQQARHRRMTQGLLDLKRLYWNLRRFRTGRRRGQSPYERLGLKLPSLTWWELLKLTPDQLQQLLSEQALPS
jgi:hypothetical protein